RSTTSRARRGGPIAGATPTTGKDNYDATKRWHFVDFEITDPDMTKACYGRNPLPPATPASIGDKNACVVDKIGQFTAELEASGTDAEERLVALKFLLRLGSVDKFDPVPGRREVQHTEKGFRELVVARCDGSVDLEVTDDPLDPVPLAIKSLIIAELPLPVRLRWNDSLDAAFSEVTADGIRVVGLVAKQSFRCPVGKINQRLVCFAVRCLPGREVEGNGAASGISETVNLTGEPAPRAAKSSFMNPPFPPAAERWARTEVLVPSRTW